MTNRTLGAFALLLVGAGCASGPPKLPYPAFIQADTLEDIFMASLPGVRAKQLAGDPQTRRTSNRVDLPMDWRGTSGVAPGRSMELFVLAGELTLSDITLRRGGYAFLPAGSLGFNLSAKQGARILYFVNDTDLESVIRSPIIMDSDLLSWEGTATPGVDLKSLRDDPGNGSKTWMVRIAPGSRLPWETSTAIREGYLIQGLYQHSECVKGKVHTHQYQTGGYFLRPASTISGGPDAAAIGESTWFLRENSKGEIATWPECIAADPEPALVP